MFSQDATQHPPRSMAGIVVPVNIPNILHRLISRMLLWRTWKLRWLSNCLLRIEARPVLLTKRQFGETLRTQYEFHRTLPLLSLLKWIITYYEYPDLGLWVFTLHLRDVTREYGAVQSLVCCLNLPSLLLGTGIDSGNYWCIAFKMRSAPCRNDRGFCSGHRICWICWLLFT